MSPSLAVCTVSLLCAAGLTWTESVHQTPALLVQAGQAAHMSCSHQFEGTFYHMDWFRQLPGQSMELIVHTVPFQPPDFRDFSRQHRYSADKTVFHSGSFTVRSVEPSDGGVYLCAVSAHSEADTCHAAHKTPQMTPPECATVHLGLSENLG